MAPVATNISNGRSGSKTVRLVERERVATLSGSAAFTVQHTMQINPALPAFLPWLSTMAQLYEKYRVKSIRVMYHNLCGTNTAGNVLMAFDPDVLDNAPLDAVSFSQSTRYIDGAPWRMLTLNIPGSNQTFFTRTGTAPVGSDLKTYDYGQIHIATEAMAAPAAATVGYVEIAYDIEFLERQPAPASGGGASIFRPQVYAGVPDPTVPVVFKHKDSPKDGNIEAGATITVTSDGVLPLSALVDDIGVETFNGSIVLPPGAYYFTASSAPSPNGGAYSDEYEDLAGHEVLMAALGITRVEPAPTPGRGAQPAKVNKLIRSYQWVDSTGAVIDAVGIADISGVSLTWKFELELTNVSQATAPESSYRGPWARAWQVNGRPLIGEGSYTQTIPVANQGYGAWPTAVITRIS
jgi:hypothetical protein